MSTAILTKELYHAIKARNNISQGERGSFTDLENSIAPYVLDSNDVSTFNSILRTYNHYNHTNGKEVPFMMSDGDIDTIPENVSMLRIEKSPVGSKYILYRDDSKIPAETAKEMIRDTGRFYNKYYNNSGRKVPHHYNGIDVTNAENAQKRADKLRASTMKHSYFDTLESSKSEYMIEDELYHHGILGMKWGIRRFQNEDGTLTPAGRKRYLTTYVDVDANGNTKISAVGDADKRRRDLEKQNERDAAKELRGNMAYRLGTILGAGSAATTASLGLIGGMGLANPAVAAAGMGGSAILGGLGYGVGSHIGKKQTGLDDQDKWSVQNLKKYDLNTSNLDYDVKWLTTSQLAKFKNGLHERDLIDSIWNDGNTVNIGKKIKNKKNP